MFFSLSSPPIYLVADNVGAIAGSGKYVVNASMSTLSEGDPFERANSSVMFAVPPLGSTALIGLSSNAPDSLTNTISPTAYLDISASSI